jgi:hypothetical protein
MDLSLIVSNILNPPILFFFLGMTAVFVKSDLEIPAPVPKLFSLYLLLAIGFKGGVELIKSGVTQEVILTLAAAMMMACIVPIYTFFILKWKLDTYDAAAIAATYGSLVNIFTADGKRDLSWPEVLQEAFLNSSVFLLVGSLLIGVLTGERGWHVLEPFTQGLFYGVLTFFLLDMGLVAARRIKDLQKTGVFLILFAILIPIVNAGIGLVIAKLIGMPRGDSLLFAVLCASASYIAVPAAMRMTVPEANPSLYVSTALAVTFPFNIIVGIPLYLYGINLFWS